MKFMNPILFTFCLIAGTAHASSQLSSPCQVLNAKKTLPFTSQIVVVEYLGGIKANMTLCQKENGKWTPKFKPGFEAVIGKNGLAPLGVKKEGDLKTPAGIYPIGEAFGTDPLALKMDYKYITADDKFIDDVNSKQYNSWVSGPTDAKSYETMLIDPYSAGAVINYNMHPSIPGLGSAIFIHVWKGANSPTAGCIALSKKDVLQLLHWLNKSQHPYILIM